MIIPQAYLPQLRKRYLRIRTGLPKQKDEVKGRLLNEAQIYRVTELLRRCNFLFEVNIVDRNLFSEDDLDKHVAGQIAGMSIHLTPEHHSTVWRKIADLQQQLSIMPRQLYVQAVTMFDLVHRVLSHATLYYVQRQPKELGEFNWYVDAKGKGSITEWERWGFNVVAPAVQAQSMREPIPHLMGADYSYLEKFLTPVPYYWGADAVAQDEGLSLNDIVLRRCIFKSDIDYGLELADIVTNAVRRALTGNLRYEGWRGISSLIVARKGYGRVRLISLKAMDSPTVKVPYADIVRAFNRGGRSMLAKVSL